MSSQLDFDLENELWSFTVNQNWRSLLNLKHQDVPFVTLLLVCHRNIVCHLHFRKESNSWHHHTGFYARYIFYQSNISS